MKKIYFFFTLFISITTFSQAQNDVQFEHSYWQWFVGADVSQERLNEFAPHFPHPKDYNFNIDDYNHAILRWQKVFCFEYEAFVNAPELSALNPYYNGYEDIIQLPFFLGSLVSTDKPKKLNFEDELNYELAVQNWYFVFKPNEFNKIYGQLPELPFWFNADTYRKEIITKIEASNKAQKEEF